MKITLHKNATTTPAVRAQIQQSSASESELAAQYGISRTTVQRWKDRDSVEDRSHTPHRLQTTLNAGQEELVVYLRRQLRMPLDDLLSVVREFIHPTMGRSSLHRLLVRRGVDKLPKPSPESSPAKPFKAYEPGYVHIDVKYLPQMADEPSRGYVFVAIDRATRWVYIGIKRRKTAAAARSFLNEMAKAAPFVIKTVAMAVAEGCEVVAAQPAGETEVLGVNSPAQLADLERRFQHQQAEALMEAGVRLADPARFDLRGTLHCGSDVEIDVNCVFEGEVVLGDGVRIGANCVMRNARIDAGAVIHPYTHIDGDAAGVHVGPGALVGPFARLRPGADLGPEVHIGNFVEVKNATLARGAKANHLAYLGDATVGERVNVGAGSITANYDGANKHRTVIGADAHVGSNCVLVAPVTVGEGATIGGGSTIAKDAPPGQLTVARAKQVSLPGWKRPVKGG